jgi:glycosyltransferase involved in cell wall biosynthesis
VNVLIVSHLYPAPGHERHLFVHEQARELARLGVGVEVLSPTGYAPRVLRFDPRLRRRALRPSQAVRDGVVARYPRVVVLPRRLLFSRSGDVYDLTLRRALPGLRERGVELVHAHQALPDGAAAAKLAAALGVPYVVTVHGVDVYQHLRLGGRVALATERVLRDAAAVVAVSHAVARLLAPHVDPARLHVNANGTTLPPDPVAPADAYGDDPLLVSAGYLIERKGHATALAALEAIAGRRGSAAAPQLAIAGDGPLKAALERDALARGLANKVHLLGRVPHAEALALMARAQLFVLPSRDEAFGLVYTEAMAQGTPVVACRGEGPQDFVHDGENGYLVPWGDAAALASVIERVLDDPEAAARLGEAARAAARELTWEANAIRQKQLYDDVLAGGVSAAAGATGGSR